MTNSNSTGPEVPPGASELPVVKTRGQDTGFQAELRTLEESVHRLRRHVSHHLESERGELSELRRELKASTALTQRLRAQLEKQEEVSRRLSRLLSDERTAHLRLSREHDAAIEILDAELRAAKLILGDALGEPATPRNSLVVKKTGNDESRAKRSADTVRPKVNAGG